MSRLNLHQLSRRLGLAAVVALGLGVAMPAAAQTVCLPHERMSKQLAEQYDERPVAIGLADSGRLVQVFAKADGDSWTIVQTTPNGMSCIAAAGRYWHAIEPEPKGLVGAALR
jgi:hypothetical protein